MTSADDAFDKLLTRNALKIPLATPSHDRRGGVMTVPPEGLERRGDNDAMRVLNIIDEAGDYRPPGYDPDARENSVFSNPTESELEPVGPDTEAAPPARAVPVRGMPDADDDHFGEDDDFRDADIVDDSDSERDDGEADDGAALSRVRRLRRFAYLPLFGSDAYEARARDLMARLSSRRPDTASLAVTSPSRGDGRTESAIRLALAMAKRVDYRVLLVDFDLRNPQVAERLGVSAKFFTVSDALRGSCPLGEALVHSVEDNLYVLPARQSDREGDEVLDDRQVGNLARLVHAHFDFAVFACGPVDNADAGIVCRHAGAAVLAGYCGRTRAGGLREAAAALAAGGVEVAGLLLTGA